jgi:hypothetical protein
MRASRRVTVSMMPASPQYMRHSMPLTFASSLAPARPPPPLPSALPPSSAPHAANLGASAWSSQAVNARSCFSSHSLHEEMAVA